MIKAVSAAAVTCLQLRLLFVQNLSFNYQLYVSSGGIGQLNLDDIVRPEVGEKLTDGYNLNIAYPAAP